MNKIVSINLGGYPFTIDEDAYELLTKYLDSIRAHFKDSEGCDEIVADIEARLAELCHESLDGKPILTLKNVEKAIQTMGRPEEFGAESTESTAESTKKGSKSSKTKGHGIKTGKKLFRNMDDKVIGGVCSGLSAYFGIQDPTILRVIVAIAFFAGGIGFLPYIILWVVVPEAKTAADKLAMRGEPINVNSIAKTIQDEVEKITQSVKKFGEDMSEKYNKEFGDQFTKKWKKKSKKDDTDNYSESDDEHSDEGPKQAFYQPAYQQDYIHKGMNTIRNIFDALFRFIGGAGKTILMIFVGILIFAVAVSWVAIIVSFGFLYPYESFFLDTPALSFLAMTSGLLIIGLPILGFMFLVLRIAFKTKLSASWGIGLTILWCVCLGMFGSIAGRTAHDFNQQARIESTSPQAWDMMTTDTLSLTTKEQHQSRAIANLGPIELIEGKLFSEQIDLEIVQSEDQSFRLKEKRFAQGPDAETADQNAKNPKLNVTLLENELQLDRQFSLKKGEKWRAQHIKLRLEVPVGKTIQLDRSINRYLNNFEAKDSWSYRNIHQGSWTMTADGFVQNEIIQE
ncbi:MAG: PspC domain-containing protein [Bacteroidota bacterium]